MGTIIPILQTRILGQREVEKLPKVIYVVCKVQERLNSTELCAFSITPVMTEIVTQARWARKRSGWGKGSMAKIPSLRMHCPLLASSALAAGLTGSEVPSATAARAWSLGTSTGYSEREREPGDHAGNMQELPLEPHNWRTVSLIGMAEWNHSELRTEVGKSTLHSQVP